MSFQQRIHYQGSLAPVLMDVCQDFSLGEYISHNVLEIGYEDFNLILKTAKGKFFIKFFAAYRSNDDIERYVNIILKVIESGIGHPQLHRSKVGYLFEGKYDDIPVQLIVMEYIPAQNVLDAGITLQDNDIIYLAQQAARINQIDLETDDYYDPWSITNVIEEFNKTKVLLSASQLQLISPVIENVKQHIQFSDLPQAFVHGDLTATNILKYQNELFIIDFSVANNYPRMQELAILLANTILDLAQPNTLAAKYHLCINAYQAITPLSKKELALLPLYLQAAYVTNILGIINAINDGMNKSKENDYWMNLGERGLEVDWEKVLAG